MLLREVFPAAFSSGTTKDEDLIRPSKGLQEDALRRAIDQPMEHPPQPEGCHPPQGGTLIGAIHVGLADAPRDENVARSRDRKGAVEAICRVCPSLTVGVRIPVIFRRVVLAASIFFSLLVCPLAQEKEESKEPLG